MAEVAGQCSIQVEMGDRLADIRYVCEAQGWGDLVYLLDMIAHEMQTRAAAAADMSVQPSDVAVERRH